MPNDQTPSTDGRDILIQQSPQFHATAIDQGIVQLGTDGTTVTVRLVLLRRSFQLERLRQVETPPESSDSGRAYRLEGHHSAIQEFEALMEPQDALRLASDLVSELQKLPSEQLEKYGLGEVPQLVTEASDD